MAGSMTGPASGKTTIALTPRAARPSTSEIAFWVFPWPSVWVQLVTLGQRLASLIAFAVVIWRHGLAAKPSAKATETGFVPQKSGGGVSGFAQYRPFAICWHQPGAAAAGKTPVAMKAVAITPEDSHRFSFDLIGFSS